MTNVKNSTKTVKKRPPDIETVSPEQWATQLSHELATEVLTLIATEEKNYGQDFGDTIRLTLIASIVSTTIYNILRTQVKGAKSLDTATEVLNLRYQDMKDAIQNAVSEGFTGAVKAWSGENRDFICDIQPEPDALNTEPC